MATMAPAEQAVAGQSWACSSAGEGLAGHLPPCTKALGSSQALLTSGEAPWRGREQKLKLATWESVEGWG